jgi:hypothetical protein
MDEVMLQSKDDILEALGIPDEKKSEGSYEQWIWYGDQRTVSINRPSYSTTNATVIPGYNQVNANVNTRTYGGGSISRTYNTYVKITFKNNIATKWDTQGVDFSIKEASGGRTLIAILLSIGVVVITVLIANNTPI